MLTKQEYEQKLSSAVDEPERIDLMNRYAWDIRRSYPQEALEISLKTKELSRSAGYRSGLAYSFRSSGTAYYLLSLYKQAIQDLNAAWELFKELGNRHAKAATIRTIGNVYHSIDEDEKSIQYYRKALEITEDLGDIQGSAYNYGNIGYVLQKTGKYPEALEYMERTRKMLNEINDRLGLADVHINMGKAYYALSEPELAYTHFKRSLEYSMEISHLRGIANAHTNIGKYFSDKNDYNIAIENHQNALITAVKMGEKMLITEVLLNISGTLEKNNKIKDALYFYKKYDTLRSEILTATGKNALNAMQTEFDLKQAETENELYRVKNIELASAYKEIEQKNKDITDSIRYARMIQDALLPRYEMIYDNFQDAFVLFKPRDIVSGDFFWMEVVQLADESISKLADKEKNQLIILAVADCTGHGVPGAFMSVIGNNYISQIISDQTVLTPGHALTLLDHKIFSSLNKSSKAKSSDGMDIALCAYHPQKQLLQYSGAKRSLFMVRNGKMTEFKPNNFSVGGEQKIVKIFEGYEITVQKDDVFYLFTDGYSDQFGGDKEKKFKIRNFLELLITNSSKPMHEQKKILEDALKDWQGKLSQVDDILVVGIRC